MRFDEYGNQIPTNDRQTGMGFPPIIIAAAIAGGAALAGSGFSLFGQSKAAKAAKKAQDAASRQAKIQTAAELQVSEQEAAQRKTMYWIAGGIALAGLATVAYLKTRKNK